jgi:glyoxylase I family protein
MQIKVDRVTVVFKVADVERTERFYRDHLGFAFERIESEEEGTFLTTRIGTETELLVFPGDPKPGNTPGVVFSLSGGGKAAEAPLRRDRAAATTANGGRPGLQRRRA